MEDIIYSRERSFKYKKNVLYNNKQIIYSISNKVLKAEIVKQIPVFKTEKVLIFMSDLIPNLSYIRRPQNLNSLNLKKLNKFINKNKEILEKKQLIQLKKLTEIKNESFNLINNTEFESYFNV